MRASRNNGNPMADKESQQIGPINVLVPVNNGCVDALGICTNGCDLDMIFQHGLMFA